MLPAATIVRNDSPVSGGCPAYAESPTLAPFPGAVDMHGAEASGGCGTLPPSLSALPRGARRRKPLSAQTTRPLSGTPSHATATDATRLALLWLGRCFDWGQALAVVQPATFLRWHRQGFRLFWRRKSQAGRPRIPAELQALIHRMAQDNPTSGEERIANELLLKLGLRVSPRTVRKYIPKRVHPGRGHRVSSQRWRTFVRNHAMTIIACDFCVVVTATFRLLYVFVIMEHATRRMLHCNVTAHPTAAWTMQQLREAIPADHTYRFLLHDRDSIFTRQLDESIRHLRLRILRTPVRT